MFFFKENYINLMLFIVTTGGTSYQFRTNASALLSTEQRIVRTQKKGKFSIKKCQEIVFFNIQSSCGIYAAVGSIFCNCDNHNIALKG